MTPDLRVPSRYSPSELGKWGEARARQHLLNKEWTILESNWRYRRYEIDVIARHHNVLIFVEVKVRSMHALVSGVASVNSVKQRRIIQTAHRFIRHQNPAYGSIRFDIISIQIGPSDWSLEHIQNAFISLPGCGYL